MISISYPVFLNTNFQIQDKSGDLICNLFGIRSDPNDVRELGEWLVGLINHFEGYVDPLSKLVPGDIIIQPKLGCTRKLIVVTEDYFKEHAVPKLNVKVDGEVKEVRPFESIPCDEARLN